MTTEIELYKIGETYIKFDFEYSESNKSKIKEAFLAQIRLSAREYLKGEQVYKISIEFEEGSLKSRIIVWGTVVYMGIGNYGSFRAGVRQIITDVRQFSEVVINNMDNDPNIAANDIIRTEKRLGFPGRLQELYSRIDAYERSINGRCLGGAQGTAGLPVHDDGDGDEPILPQHQPVGKRRFADVADR